MGRTFLESLTPLTLVADCSAKDRAGLEPAKANQARSMPILARFVRVAWAMPLVQKTLSELAANRQHCFDKNFPVVLQQIAESQRNRQEKEFLKFWLYCSSLY